MIMTMAYEQNRPESNPRPKSSNSKLTTTFSIFPLLIAQCQMKKNVKKLILFIPGPHKLIKKIISLVTRGLLCPLLKQDRD